MGPLMHWYLGTVSKFPGFVLFLSDCTFGLGQKLNPQVVQDPLLRFLDYMFHFYPFPPLGSKGTSSASGDLLESVEGCGLGNISILDCHGRGLKYLSEPSGYTARSMLAL